jgi:hypothetical protein
VWLDQTTDEVIAQRLNANGTTGWGAGGVVLCPGAAGGGSCSVAPDGAGGAIVPWENTPGGYDVYAQKVSAAGSVPPPAGGFPLCTATNIQERAYAVASVPGAAIVTWVDHRNGFSNRDIYAQRTDQVTVSVAEAGSGNGPLALRVRPNPVPLAASIKLTLPRDGKARVTIYDVAGRRVRTLAGAWFARGPHAITWDGRNDRGVRVEPGVYVVRVEHRLLRSSQRVTVLE